jgi:ubiquinone/menaquinone biosynthesis C-methylase UbiE
VTTAIRHCAMVGVPPGAGELAHRSDQRLLKEVLPFTNGRLCEGFDADLHLRLMRRRHARCTVGPTGIRSPCTYPRLVRTSVDYDEHQCLVYAEGRALSPARAELWSRIFAKHLDRAARLTVLDLGCGTGMYSQLLAEALDADVVGVEPSVRMREVAEREHAHPRVRYVAGSAEQIPLPAASCDAALLSDLAHHIADHDACARELRRVLRRPGLVLLRGIGPDSSPQVRFLDFFPTARPIARQQAAAFAELIETLAGTGFDRVHSQTIEQELAASLREYHDRVKLRAISTLELLSDAEFECGMARLRDEAGRESAPRAVIERVDLAVLRRS